MEEKKILVDPRDIYIDVANQVILMNMMARLIWEKSEKDRLCFEKIHNAYIALENERTLIKHIKQDTFDEFFEEALREKQSTDNPFQEVLAKFHRFGQGSNSETMSSLNQSASNDNTGNHYFAENSFRLNILKNVFHAFDKKQRLSNYNNSLENTYNDFLATLLKGAEHTDNTFGYGHQNLYICLYHFDHVFEKLIRAHKEYTAQSSSTKNKKQSISELTDWTRESISMYESNLAKNTAITDIELVDWEESDCRPVKIKVVLQNTLFQQQQENGNKESIAKYSENICSQLNDWLTQYLLKGKAVLTQSDTEKYNAYHGYKKFRSNNTLPSPIETIKGIPTFCYALLAWDHCYGLKSNSSLTKNDKKSVQHVKDNYYSEALGSFPEAGIIKKLRSIAKFEIKKDGPHIYELQEELTSFLIESEITKNSFFTYPLLLNPMLI